MKHTIPFDNSYARLPPQFYARLDPTPVAEPRLLALNTGLAEALGLDADWLASPEGVAVLAGNTVPEGAEPLAQAYAGHQFGNWVPQLGDGRAILLGEVVDRQGGRRDIQLKGSGPTPFSRMGDGRAWLGPVLREYLVSEAMHAMGIPTTRSLAAVATGETILRERPLPGAVLTRVARSHIRVGTFQFFYAREDRAGLEALTRHAIARHYPAADGALGLLHAVIAAQAELIAAWMAVGFIHGVMNTDNMSIAGETIDYGPCAFMDAYDPGQVYSSIDRHGRYAYNRQPDIAVWDLAQLATALLPLIDDDKERAVETATEALHGFAPIFQAAHLRRFRAKLGLRREEPEDPALIARLLDVMAAEGADFTNTFRALAEGRPLAPAFADWIAAWEARSEREAAEPAERAALMRGASPAVIPRNHRIEAAIEAATAGDLAPFHALGAALARPFEPPQDAALAEPPRAEEEVLQTFCGT